MFCLLLIRVDSAASMFGPSNLIFFIGSGDPLQLHRCQLKFSVAGNEYASGVEEQERERTREQAAVSKKSRTHHKGEEGPSPRLDSLCQGSFFCHLGGCGM